MNPLEEYPHLFTNGKFKVRIPDNNMKVGHRDRELSPHILQTDVDDMLIPPLKRCTLIARPISSMTDKEVDEISTIPMSVDKKREYLEAGAFSDIKIYLLSIGVYPFNQDHFENGTVIDATKLKEKA